MLTEGRFRMPELSKQNMEFLKYKAHALIN